MLKNFNMKFSTLENFSKNKIYDTVVIGLGGSGSSTLYHLSKTGRSVLGIDRFNIPHSNGSSHGDTRIIRQAYFEGEYYVPFVKRAYELWENLERLSGEKLYLQTGCMNISKSEDGLVEQCRAVTEKYNLKYNVLDSLKINKKYSFFSMPEEYTCLEEENAGMLFPEKCVSTYISEARKNKAEILLDTEIDKINYINSDKLFTLSSHKSNLTVKTNSLVISCGAWANNILKNFNMHLPLTIDLNYIYYFKFKDSKKNNKTFPIYLISYDNDYFYGFPDINNGNGYKVSLYHQSNSFDDMKNLDRNFKKGDLMDKIGKLCKIFIRDFSHENVEMVKLINCLYTSTPDKDFIIDYLPMYNDKVVLVSACSGHGFKFTSRIGEYATNLLDQKEKPFEKFTLARLLN